MFMSNVLRNMYLTLYIHYLACPQFGLRERDLYSLSFWIVQ